MTMTLLAPTTAAPSRRLGEDRGLEVVTRADRGRGERRQVRSDALPEHIDYRDDGCDLFPSCLSCPLARCRYDVPGGVRALLNRERDRQMRLLRTEAGLSVDAIAERFQVSRRTVFRALALPGGRGCAPAVGGGAR